MNTKVLREIVKTDNKQDGLANLFESHYAPRTDIPLNEYVVKQGEDMRIDLIFQSMYELDAVLCQYYLDQFDIILTLNNIDNPLNILEGTVLVYPQQLERIDEFRIKEDNFRAKNNNLTNRLIVPNVGRKVDPKRKQYINSGYSFPPTILKEPRDPVTVQNGKFYIGGIQ